MIHLFNPENDLALALGCRHYTPPPHASALRSAGALLPMWWAAEGDLILLPEATTDAQAEAYREGARRLSERFGLHGTPVRSGDDADGIVAGHRPAPWGWSADAARRFERAGVNPELIPDAARIEAMRSLSHRRTSAAILRAMGTPDDRLPIEACTPEEAVEMNRRYPGCYLKAPWSGSGRGVAPMAGMTDDIVSEKAAGIIHRQGSVMVERGVDKLLDFAALYRSEGGRVNFEGLSVFRAESRGMYQGNIVAQQGRLESMLSALYPLSSLIRAISLQAEILTDIVAGDYEGWMGVDMMLGREADGSVALHPCVELNLRRTMGVVAMQMARRLRVQEPALLAWHRGPAPAGSQPLLPPAGPFSLALNRTEE